MKMLELSALPLGADAEVTGFLPGREVSGRLSELGFTPGSNIKCLFAAPSGSPRAYLVKNTVIALRDTDASAVLLRQ